MFCLHTEADHHVLDGHFQSLRAKSVKCFSFVILSRTVLMTDIALRSLVASSEQH